MESHDVGVAKKPAEEESRPPPKEKSQKALASGKFKGPEKAAKAEPEAVAAASPALRARVRSLANHCATPGDVAVGGVSGSLG